MLAAAKLAAEVASCTWSSWTWPRDLVLVAEHGAAELALVHLVELDAAEGLVLATEFDAAEPSAKLGRW